MKKLVAGTFLILLLAWLAALFLRGGEVIVVLPDGKPVEGAQVWVSHVSASALLQGSTDAKGRAMIPAKTVRRGGWHSIIASWEDPDGNRYVGENLENEPKFPLTIRISKR